MSENGADPLDAGGFDEPLLEALTERIREGLRQGVTGPDSAVGLPLRELDLDAEGLVVTVRLGEEVLLAHDFEPEAWEAVEPDDPAFDVEGLAETLTRELVDRVDVSARLVERRRTQLADRVVDEVEAAIQTQLEAERPEIDWDVMAEVIELSYEYQHGDPEWVYEQGYPPYGLEVTSWDPDAEVVVEIAEGTPDTERLVDEAMARLLEAVDDE